MQTERPQEAKPKKDFWEKADVVAKIAIPVVIVVFGFMGNHYLSKQQERESSVKLFTQLLSDKETAENTLRKDMFSKIIESFIDPGDKKRKGIEQIERNLLSLELLTRNFHESLDMKPLFKHLMLDIVRQRAEIRRAAKELEAALESTDGNQDVALRMAVLNADTVLDTISAQDGTKGSQAVKSSLSSGSGRWLKEQAASKKAKLDGQLKRYDSAVRDLVEIAKRVSRKQGEVLKEVAGKLPINFTKEEMEGRTVELKPPEKPSRDKTAGKDNCISKEGRLALKDHSGKEINGSARHFQVSIPCIYPKWRNVYVEVESWRCLEKGPVRNCERCRKDSEKETSAFWLDYFSFPLVDNTYVDNEYRYSVVLENIEVNQENKVEKAAVGLLYYPASYAGMKEKSFYNNRVLNNLLKSDLFRKDEPI